MFVGGETSRCPTMSGAPNHASATCEISRCITANETLSALSVAYQSGSRPPTSVLEAKSRGCGSCANRCGIKKKSAPKERSLFSCPIFNLCAIVAFDNDAARSETKYSAHHATRALRRENGFCIDASGIVSGPSVRRRAKVKPSSSAVLSCVVSQLRFLPNKERYGLLRFANHLGKRLV